MTHPELDDHSGGAPPAEAANDASRPVPEEVSKEKNKKRGKKVVSTRRSSRNADAACKEWQQATEVSGLAPAPRVSRCRTELPREEQQSSGDSAAQARVQRFASLGGFNILEPKAEHEGQLSRLNSTSRAGCQTAPVRSLSLPAVVLQEAHSAARLQLETAGTQIDVAKIAGTSRFKEQWQQIGYWLADGTPQKYLVWFEYDGVPTPGALIGSNAQARCTIRVGALEDCNGDNWLCRLTVGPPKTDMDCGFHLTIKFQADKEYLSQALPGSPRGYSLTLEQKMRKKFEAFLEAEQVDSASASSFSSARIMAASIQFVQPKHGATLGLFRMMLTKQEWDLFQRNYLAFTVFFVKRRRGVAPKPAGFAELLSPDAPDPTEEVSMMIDAYPSDSNNSKLSAGAITGEISWIYGEKPQVDKLQSRSPLSAGVHIAFAWSILKKRLVEWLSKNLVDKLGPPPPGAYSVLSGRLGSGMSLGCVSERQRSMSGASGDFTSAGRSFAVNSSLQSSVTQKESCHWNPAPYEVARSTRRCCGGGRRDPEVLREERVSERKGCVVS